MSTIKRYNENPYEKTCTATVLSCTKNEDENRYDIILDQTIFYPEGGGQNGDRGLIGDTPIFDTHEIGENVIHYSEAPLVVGQEYTLAIDWEYRFMLMQHHTGEHMISGLICAKYGFHNVGFHMGADSVTIDFDGKIPDEDLLFLENETNKGIQKNIPVKTVIYTSEEELQKVNYRSKIELSGEVRIVTVAEYDCCACCGTHVKYTGEVGFFKIIDAKNYKGGTRLELLCGERAVAYANMCHKTVKTLGEQFSTKRDKVLDGVTKLTSDLNAANLQIQELRKELLQYKGEILKKICQEKGIKKVVSLEVDCTSKQLGACADGLLSILGGTVATLSKTEQNIAIVVCSADEDLSELNATLKSQFQFKGGGKPNRIQGSAECNIDTLLAFFTEKGYFKNC